MSNARQNAIVTGAGSGLGRALSLRLARDGWNLALCDVIEDRTAETLRLVEQAGGSGRVELLDVTQVDQWQALEQRLRADWEHLDLLINNAGVAGSGNVGEYSLDDWRWILDVNLMGGIYGCHTFVEWLKSNPRGAHIINTASAAAFGAAPTMAAYNVTKAGMLALSETLYSELYAHGVGVTVLCPAFFPTNLLEKGRFATPEQREMGERGFRKSPITADDVADAAIRAMQRKQLYVILPGRARFAWFLKRLSPRMYFKQVIGSMTGGVPKLD